MKQGTRIPKLKPGYILGRRDSNKIIEAVNAFMNLLVRREDPEGLLISDQNSVLKLGTAIGGSGSASVSAYLFRGMGDDVLTCRSLDFTTEGDTDILIAKPPQLRGSITSEVIDGVTVSYSSYDPDAQTRVADDGTNTETQVITSRYLDGCVIYAITAPTDLLNDDSSPITLIDLNLDARGWAAIA